MVANIPPQKTPIQMLYNAKSIICTYLTVMLTEDALKEPNEAKRNAASKKNSTEALVKGVPKEPTEQSEGVQLANYFLPVEPNPPTRSVSVLPESASKRFINIPCAIRSPLFISCVTLLIFKRNIPMFPSSFLFP